MPQVKHLKVKDLSLDLRNFRTVPQESEEKSIHAMISINPVWFWALLESILTDGYLHTENIIVLEKGQESIVKEGNRRVAVLKLILGLVDRKRIAVPPELEVRIKKVTAKWKVDNDSIPCAVFDASEADKVDKIITLTHGKSEQAGRDKWNAVARARHNRDFSGASEPPLDLLEAYLKNGKNRTPVQAEQWAGVYPLSVLEEAIKRLAGRFECGSSRELADKYPHNLDQVAVLENVLRDIGAGTLGFDTIRNSDFGTAYGLPPVPSTTKTSGSTSAGGTASGTGGATGGSAASGSTSSTGATNPPAAKKPKAAASDDPKAVMRVLRKFKPKGLGREKVVLLLNEMRTLKIERQPHSFCFLLRSMFEISAKVYCDDHKGKAGAPTATKAGGEDKRLVDLLKEVIHHMTNGSTDAIMKKVLHGAMADLAQPDGLLSVTSMNQLVHNKSFVMSEKPICRLFFNIFPLLEKLNE